MSVAALRTMRARAGDRRRSVLFPGVSLFACMATLYRCAMTTVIASATVLRSNDDCHRFRRTNRPGAVMKTLQFSTFGEPTDVVELAEIASADAGPGQLAVAI